MGAGPAGSSAAAALARRGLSVLLLEKAVLPRYKTCGGGILPRAWRMLPASAPAVVESTFTDVLVNFQGENLRFTASGVEPLVRMTMRAELDHLLASDARQAGTELLEGCPVKNVEAREDAVELTTDQGRFQARYLVAADGAQSMAAKAGGWPPLPLLAPALEWEIHLPPEVFARFSQTARFDFGFVRAGYAWVFPKRNHLSTGILTTERTSINLAAKLEDYLRFLGIGPVERIEKHGYVIPIKPRRGPLARGRILLAGDAAGLVDPVTAEGISYALLSGRLAAEAVADGGTPNDVAAHYQTLLERNILRDLRAGRLLARFIYHHPRTRNWLFRWHGERLTRFVTEVVMGERGYSAALKDPRSYLKMLARR